MRPSGFPHSAVLTQPLWPPTRFSVGVKPIREIEPLFLWTEIQFLPAEAGTPTRLGVERSDIGCRASGPLRLAAFWQYFCECCCAGARRPVTAGPAARALERR